MVILIRRHIDLIQLLIQQNKCKPASFFGEELHVSSKTIYSDIHELEVFIKNFGLELTTVPGSGIRLEGASENKKELLKFIHTAIKKDGYSKEMRRMMIVKKIFVDVQNISLDELSREFIVSKTSLYNDIAIIEKMMNEENVHIIINHDGIECKGRESKIQRAIEKFIMYFNAENKSSIEDTIEAMFDSKVVCIVDQLLFHEYSELTDHVSDYYIDGLRLSMMILLSRLDKGFHLEKEEEFLFNSLKFMETFIVANTMVEKVKRDLMIDFTNEDIEYLSQQLFAHRITSKIKSVDPQYEDTVRTIIERMEEMEKIDFSQDERLYKSLLYHVPAMIVRLQKGVQVQNPLLLDIKNQYTKLFTVVWYALSFIESEYDLILNDDEVSLVLIYFQLSLEKLAKVRNIIIVCPYGTSSSQLIMNKVKQFLPTRDHIEVSNISKLKEGNLKNVDLIITPVDVDFVSVPTVKVNPLINDEDLINIMSAYTNKVLKPERLELLSGLNKAETPIIAKYIDSSLIKLDRMYSSKEECLDSMITELENNRFVDPLFRISIFNREKMGSTSLETGVALPHADPDKVNIPSISITTLKKPIKWGDVNISLVIMVALSEQEIDQFSTAISEVYKLVDRKEKVNEIVSIKSVADFMKLFQK